ncbi:Rrf2 family transcriptional regulator [Agrobacterium tumefaciens]|uniref:Rrf2 family transcriptional regulator n=1 Tax=Agrobacterium tumefaciens TaxID=358 RepID=UPI001571D2BF|nr:Rrf2 family transcriptional regulator [Agrobacterium tumefaciens]NSX94412.1 Rrf2 family transcriptional regulator [Agrobacterium tumefaciens]
MNISALAVRQQGERTILSSVKHMSSPSALDSCIKSIIGAHAQGQFDDAFVESVYEAVNERRAEVIADQKSAARRPVKWGTPLHASSKLTLEERRSQARARHKCAGWFSDKLAKAGGNLAEIYERLPRASVRAVLHAICELCALARGRCDASIATIADKAGCSRSAVEQALAHLKASGFILIESGKAAGVTSIIRPAMLCLVKVVNWCRARLERFKEKTAAPQRPGSAAGGTQKDTQKSDSIFFKRNWGGEEPNKGIVRDTETVAFPASGTIYFTRWRDLVKKHAKGVTPDSDVVADAFRKFCKDKNIPLDAPKIEDRFIKIVEKFRI